MLLLSDFEAPVLARELADLPLAARAALPPDEVARRLPAVRAALARVDGGTCAAAYQAWLGFYSGWSKRCAHPRDSDGTRICL